VGGVDHQLPITVGPQGVTQRYIEIEGDSEARRKIVDLVLKNTIFSQEYPPRYYHGKYIF